MLAGQDATVAITPPPGAEVSFGTAAREWLRYVEHDRKRRRSTVQDYRRELERRLIPEFGEDTPLAEITTERIDRFRERMVSEGQLSARRSTSDSHSCTRSSSALSGPSACQSIQLPAQSANRIKAQATSGP